MTSITEWLHTAQGVAAAIGAFLVALAPIVRKVLLHWAYLLRLARRERKMDNSHIVSHMTKKCLARMVERTECKRALLIVARNCGWKDPTLPVSISVIGEALWTPKGPSAFERWQDVRADPGFRDLLNRIWSAREDGRGVLSIPDGGMHPGALEDYHLEGGVAASVAFFVQTMPDGAMLFVQLDFGCLHDDHRDVPACDLEEQREIARRFHKAHERVRREVAAMRAIWKDEAQ